MAVVPCSPEELPEARMKFVCDRCQTRYSIADEKVRQKILRIRCKTCGNVILVQESASAPEGAPGVSAPHLAAASSGPKLPPPGRAAAGSKLTAFAPVRSVSEPKTPSVPTAKAAGPKAPPSTVPLKAASGLKAALSESQKGRLAVPPPPPPAAIVAPDPLGGRVEWYVAVSGAQSGPFSRAEAAKRIVALEPTKAVHVWKEGMAGWKVPNEVSVIAREINILRPPPPPPPAPSLTPRPAAEAAKAGVTPLPLSHGMPHAEKVPADKGTPRPSNLFQGKPATPATASQVAAASDFHTDGETEADAFSDVITEKKTPVVEASPSTDVTTSKGKNLRDLESDPLRVASAHKRTDAAAIRASLGEPPTLPNPPSLTPAPQSGPLVTFDAGPASVAPSSPAGGFDEVVAAMATVEPTGTPTGSAPAMVVPVMSGAYAASTEPAVRSSRLVGLFQGRSGFKYMVAAVVLMALVILLVAVSLRGDGGKRPAITKETPEEAVSSEPTRPADEPAVAQPSDDRSGGGSRPAPKHPGSAVKTRSVGPAEKSVEKPVEKPVASPPKQIVKPQKGDSARPNPFGDSVQAVSQEKISAVVRDRNNQMGLRSCYERALKMDNHLTSGRMDITVSIAPSGIVKSVVVNAPSAFIMVEPCIKLAVKRWHFPANFEEYGTNFPLIMQGGM